MQRIERVHAREVFDSRGKPTVEVEVTCAGARPGRAIVPSGASTGQFEAIELRDGDPARLDGTGVLRAVEHVRGEISRAVIGMDAGDQAAIDKTLCELDGTPNKSRLGANAILGVSLATAYAAAEAQGIAPIERFRQIWESVLPAAGAAEGGLKPAAPAAQDPPAVDPPAVDVDRTAMLGGGFLLPLPMVNMISGGLHAGRNLDFQDFLILPVGATSYRQAFEWIVTVYRRLSQLLGESGYEGALVGDEGGYGPKLASNSEAVEFVMRAIERAGLTPGDDVAIGLDVASTHFYRDGHYHLTATGGLNRQAGWAGPATPAATGDSRLSADDVIGLLESWVDSYPIISIEDGLADDDWQGWKKLTERIGRRVQLIGDDLFVTNRSRLERGIADGTANSVLIKPNQIGTLWETLETLRLAIDAGYWPVVSARSGETEDTTIADLVVATGAGQLKVGSVARSERLAKYNQLLRLEEQLGDRASYLGGAIFDALRRA